MNPQSFVARTPDDLIALVPYLLGFHPEESVVLLTFGAPAGSFHARVDLPTGSAERAEVVAVLCTAVASNRAPVTAVLVFSEDLERSRDICMELVPELQLAGASVIDAIRVDGQCWWSVLDDEPDPHPYDTSSHPFTAERVFEGHAALGSRAEVADSLVGTDQDEVARVCEAADQVAGSLRGVGTQDALAAAHRQAEWLHERLVDAVRDEEVLSSQDAGRVLALVRIGELRAVVWGRMSREDASAHVRLWRDLVRRSPEDLSSRAAGLLAFAAWLAGDGALAWCAVERCLERDPDDDLAHSVAGVLQRALPPSTWTPLPVSDLLALDGWQERAS